MTNEDARAGRVRYARCAAASRIEFPLQHDGATATLIWIWCTLAIYRRYLPVRKQYVHSAEYRLKFIVSFLEFRDWLVVNGGYESRGIVSPTRLYERKHATLAATLTNLCRREKLDCISDCRRTCRTSHE